MSEINLLPEGYKIKGSVKKLSGTIRKISTISVMIFVLISTVMVGLYLFYSRRVQQSLDNQNELKRQISALEDTEQKLILVKDRLEEVEEYQSTDQVFEEVEEYKVIKGYQNDDLVITNVNIEVDTIEFEVRATDKDTLYDFFNKLENSSISFAKTGEIKYGREGGFQTFLIVRL